MLSDFNFASITHLYFIVFFVQFTNIIGQKATKQYLIDSVQHNRISHAQLFLGAEGSGNLALALAYAQYVVCENKQAHDSCGECNPCRKAQKMIHPDIHYSYPTIGSKVKSTDFAVEWREAIAKNPYQNAYQWLQYLKADNKQGNITTDECDDIVRKLSLMAYEAQYKILVMWLPEYLGKEGNRLLKIIEEPPENTLFLLVAENADLIINTILSRTQMLRIPRIEEDALIEVLQKRQYLPLESAQQIALLAEGNYNEALNLIANFNNDNQTMLVRWLTIILQRQLNHFNAQTERFTELGRESQKNFLRYSLHFLRQCMLLKAIPKHRLALTQPETELARQITPTINIDKLEQIFKLLNDAYYHIERNANPRILFFNLTIKVGDVLLH